MRRSYWEVNEIEKAAAVRNNYKADPYSLAQFERDFHLGSWFHEHPRVESVAEIYFYDFEEKRLRVHR